MTKISIAINLDNVLNNLVQLVDHSVAPIPTQTLSFDDLIAAESTSYYRHASGELIRDMLKKPDIYEELKVRDDWTYEGFKFLCENFDVLVVSSCHDESCEYKRQWIKKNFPFFDMRSFIPCTTNTCFDTDWLIDDGVRIGNFLKSRILMDSPYNRRIDEGFGNIRRMTSWEEILKFFRIVKDENIKTLSLF